MAELEVIARKIAKKIAPATTKAKEDKKQRDFFGTVQVSSDGAYVLVDGAPDSIRPRFSVNCLDGDRVMLHIMNHRAVVIANITNPNLTTAEVIEHVKENPNTGVIQNIVISDSTLQDVDLHGFYATDGTLENTYIKGSSIDGSTFRDGTISGSAFVDGTISGSKITGGSITGAQIAESTISGSNIVGGSITGSHIAEGTIENSNIKDSSIEGGKIIGSTLKDIPYAEIDQLKANNISANDIKSATGYIADLTAENITTQDLIADHATISDLDATYAKIETLEADYATIDELHSKYIETDVIAAQYATIANLDAAKGRITNLESTKADITFLESNYADIEALDAGYAHIDLLNVNNSWIQNGVIKDAAIGDAQILGVSANKLTAGTIDAGKINVANLRAKNLIVEKLNGQPVLGGYELVNSNMTGYSSKNPKAEGWYEYSNGGWVASTDTVVDPSKVYYKDAEQVALYDQTYIDGLETSLNQRIDGAVETFTGTAVPTMVTYPVADWETSEYQSHVGDIYYVVNQASDQNGYCYRFAYDSTSQSYGWVLIKDSDVTKALSDITDLQTFESETVSWQEETDEGLRTIRQNHTSLSGKVDDVEATANAALPASSFTTFQSTTFKELVDEVDEQSSTITSMSDRIDTKADNSAVQTLTNTVNSVKQTADTNSASITQVTKKITQKYATCSTAAGTQAKVATLADFELYAGADVYVKFSNANTVSSPTLNVNSTGAKSVLGSDGSALTSDQYWGSGETVHFVYNGTSWLMQPSAAEVSTLTTKTSTITQTLDGVKTVIGYTEDASGHGSSTLVSKVNTIDSTVTGTVQSIQSVTTTLKDGGRNLWPDADYGNGLPRTYQGITVSKVEDGLYKAVGTTIGTGDIWWMAGSDTLKVKPGTYTLSMTIESGSWPSSGIVLQCAEYSSNAWHRDIRTEPGETAVTFTCESGYYPRHIGFYSSASGVAVDITFRVQIEHGSIATSWSAAPEDFTTLSKDYANYKQTVNEFEATVGKVVAGKGDNLIVYNPDPLTMLDVTYTGQGATNWPLWAHSGSENANSKGSPYVTNYTSDTASKKYLMLTPFTPNRFKAGDVIRFEGRLGNWEAALNLTPSLYFYSTSTGSNTVTYTGKAIAMPANAWTDANFEIKIPDDANLSASKYYVLGLSTSSNARLAITASSRAYVESNSVLSAETSIKSNADAISLRATKSEAYQSAQPNLSPMFSSHNTDGTYPNGGDGGFWQPSNDKTYNRSFFTALEDGWMHVNAANNSQKEFVPPRVDDLKANDRVTMLVEWRNASWTGNGMNFYSRNYPSNVQLPANWNPAMNTASGEARHTYVVSSADGNQAWNGLVNWTFTSKNSSSTWTGDIRISFYKETYDSNTSSYVQYSGPYKPYTGTQLYASQSELKITADGISSTVSKIGAMKYFTTTYSYPLSGTSSIKTYAAEGYNGGWNVSESTDGTRIGDVVYIKVHDSTRNCDVYIKGTVTAVSATRLQITSHGYEDTIPVDTIKSTINQSADSVKIQAKHVEIDGAAIFSNTAFKAAADAAYDAKGAAANAVNDLEIGGTNLLRNTSTGTGWSYTSFDSASHTFTRSTTATSESYIQSNSRSYLMYELGVEYTLSCYAKSNGQVSSMDLFTYDQNMKNIKSSLSLTVNTDWTFYEFTFKYDSWASGTSPTGFVVRFDNNGSKTSGTEAILYVKDVKLEKGGKATDWSAAPEDIVARTQRIYYRSKVSGKVPVPTDWITNTANKYNDTVSVGNAGWSTKVTPMAAGVDSTKYLYLYTCEQSQSANGTLKHTTVLLDDSNTVIDGGNIITGSVTANKLNATDINAQGILAVGSLNAAAQKALKNSEITDTFNGYTILWNYENFSTANNGEGYICKLDPLTGTKSDANGTVMWNGTSRTVTKQMINPNAIAPYNIPIYVVCRLSSATAVTGTNYIVWYNSGWKYASLPTPTAVGGTWTWADATDIVLGMFVEPGSELALTDCIVYDPPWSSKQVTTDIVTARSANAAAAAAQSTANTANNKANAWRGTETADMSAAAKNVACTGFTTDHLVTGTAITVYCNNSQGNTGKLTLNVNSTGAHDVWVGGGATSDTNRLLWLYGCTITFIYVGTSSSGYWKVVDNPPAYYGATCSVAEGTAAKTTVVDNAILYKGATISVPFTNSNTSSAMTLAVLNAEGTSIGASTVYHGSSTNVPTKVSGTSGNGLAWPAGEAVIFTYDGKFWRTGNQTFIDGGHVTTGTISADRIAVSGIAIGSLNGGAAVVSNANAGKIASDKLGNVLQPVTGYFSNDSTARYVEICKGTIACNSNAASGSIRISGVIGGYINTNQGYMEITIGNRGVPPYAICGQKDSTIDYKFANIVAYYDSSYIVHVYLVKPTTGTYTKYNLNLENASEFTRVATTSTTAPSGTKFFDLSTAATEDSKTATNYITADSTGIKVHNASDTTNYIHQTSSGTKVYKGGNLKADYADTITLYGGSAAAGAYPKTEISSSAVKLYQSANYHADITSSGMEVFAGGSKRALFGSTAYVYGGNGTYPYVQVGSSGIDVKQSATTYLSVSANNLSMYVPKSNAAYKAFELSQFTTDCSLMSMNSGVLDISAYGVPTTANDNFADFAVAGNGKTVNLCINNSGGTQNMSGDIMYGGFAIGREHACYSTSKSGGGLGYSGPNTMVSLMEGSGGVNHGLYDHLDSSWMLYADKSWNLHLGQADVYTNTYVHGDTVYLGDSGRDFSYKNVSATSSAKTVNAGAGLSISFSLAVPSGYQFAGIYNVTCNHNIACSIGRFSYSSSDDQATVNVTNRSSTNYTDLTVSMGVHFIRPVITT